MKHNDIVLRELSEIMKRIGTTTKEAAESLETFSKVGVRTIVIPERIRRDLRSRGIDVEKTERNLNDPLIR